MLATLASQIPILAPASPPLGSGFFDLTPFDQKTGHSSLRVYQDPQKLIFYYILGNVVKEWLQGEAEILIFVGPDKHARMNGRFFDRTE